LGKRPFALNKYSAFEQSVLLLFAKRGLWAIRSLLFCEKSEKGDSLIHFLKKCEQHACINLSSYLPAALLKRKNDLLQKYMIQLLNKTSIIVINQSKGNFFFYPFALERPSSQTIKSLKMLHLHKSSHFSWIPLSYTWSCGYLTTHPYLCSGYLKKKTATSQVGGPPTSGLGYRSFALNKYSAFEPSAYFLFAKRGLWAIRSLLFCEKSEKGDSLFCFLKKGKQHACISLSSYLTADLLKKMNDSLQKNMIQLLNKTSIIVI